ncbi:MAG: hypothetical protein GX232_02710 [Acholeplasmataceae bacterium]|nr:hypothetical protein [Acholeplasmataceae bacterium]
MKRGFKKIIWGNTSTRIWFLVSSIVMVFFLTVTIIATQQSFIKSTLDIALGYPRAITGEEQELFVGDYNSKEEVLDAANQLNIEIASEGFTLLHNKNGNSLPLSKNAKLSVFGKNSTNLLYGGSGSGASQSGDNKTIFDSLTEAGFTYNEKLKRFYETSSGGRGRSPDFDQIIGGFPTGETPVSELINSESAQENYSGYTDAALVVFTRIGGEGFDLPRSMANATLNSAGKVTQSGYTDIPGVYKGTIEGARKNTDHYLQLDANEVDLLLHVTEKFEKVILILNTNNTLELGFLDDPEYWKTTFGITGRDDEVNRAIDRICGALWIGSPGSHGIMALGKILSGEINPSGKTTNTYVRNFWNDPTIQNFGNNNEQDGNAYRLADGSFPSTKAYYVEYEEGIYVGYRYWETRAADPHPTDGLDWYEKNVVFPFGYGLSYSNFSWTIDNIKLGNKEIADNYILTEADYDKQITINVKVKNESETRSGKDVVQLYIETPYYNGIEKAFVVLTDFIKTPEIDPKKTAVVSLSFNLFDIASYDYNDDNSNGFAGWELEKGEYTMYVMSHANAWRNPRNQNILTSKFVIPQSTKQGANEFTGFQYLKDPNIQNSADIVNRFDDVSYGIDGTKENPKIKYLSRTNWVDTFPKTPTFDERKVATQRWISMNTNWQAAFEAGVISDNPEDPWYSETMPNQAISEVDPNAEETIALNDMIGIPYDDPKWDEFLDQLTVSQMINLVGLGAFGTVSLSSIGLPIAQHSDGPAGFTNFMALEQAPVYDTCFYASPVILGATYNKELAEEFGTMIGNEALVGNERGDKMPYSGWYAPAINIHRSQFSGRNWEYYSEDPIVSGKIGARIVKGAREKGVITFAKHFALNDQETSRSQLGIMTWANEQSMREIYLKAFEILVKEGKSLGIMSSYNRIGVSWTGGDYRLMTEILRDEWGFCGVVVTDYATPSYVNPSHMIRAGGDLQLNQGLSGLNSNVFKDSATHVTQLRRASKNILYSTANSNLMNKMVIGYKLPYWIIGLICVNIGLFVIFSGWGAVVITLAYKKQNKKEERYLKK